MAAGVSVDAATISAHRDMSETTCPGDALYALVRSKFSAEVSALRGTQVGATPSSIVVPTEPTATQPEPNTAVTQTTANTSTTIEAPPTSERGPDSETSSGPTGADSNTPTPWPLVAAAGVVGVGVLGVAGGAAAAARRRGAAIDDPSIIAWRISGGTEDPLLQALAMTGRSAMTADPTDWWTDLAEHWQLGPQGADGSANGNGPSSFMVASDGRRALVRLTGNASGDATAADGSTIALSAPGVTKIWLTTVSVSLTVDGQVTQLTQAGAEGPVDRFMQPSI